MISRVRKLAVRPRNYLCATAIGLVLAGFAVPAWAEPLAPQTRLRLSVIQWMPMSGQYEQWSALGGELVVSPAGEVTVPVIGAIAVGERDPGELATEIARLLQARLGLVTPPDASIEVLDYPPIYVVGAVKQPGEYKFRPGMTVLQALALGGGQLRSETTDNPIERIRLLGTLQDTRDQILRATVRISRLQAEFSGAGQITFPDPGETGDKDLALERTAQEQAVFEARNNAAERQQVSYVDLSKLYDRELEVLQMRIDDLDISIAAAETELEGVRSLVEGGMATVSRRSELERIMSSLRADRLDQMTAMMRARQYQSEVGRNMNDLRDQRRTQAAQELLTEQAGLEQLRLQEATSLRLLQELDRKALLDAPAGPDAKPVLVYTIVREHTGEVIETPALESTILRPADVVKVALDVQAAPPGAGVSGSASLAALPKK